MSEDDDKIRIQSGAVKQASGVVDQLRSGGVNTGDLAREGLKEKLRESLSDEERVKIHQQFKMGKISREVAEILIGDGLEEIERETAAFDDAMDLDTDGVYQD